MNATSTTEERIWAVLSHLSALALGMGIVLPIVGWADQRRKSTYASFQCLQALGYQSLGFTVWILSYLVIIIAASIILLAMFGSRAGSSETVDTILRPWMVVVFVVVFGFLALYFLLPIIAAIGCALGKDFRYPIMGNRLARYLGYAPRQKSEGQGWLNEEHEFRWVAGTGHFSILILFWGMLAPLTTWILYGKHSSFLKFQSIQTLVYQAGTTVLYFGIFLLYSIGLFSLIATMGWTSQREVASSAGIFGIVIFGLSMLLAFLIALIVPLLHILGQWAGYRVLKDGNYRYPVVGGMVEQWISRQTKALKTFPPGTGA